MRLRMASVEAGSLLTVSGLNRFRCVRLIARRCLRGGLRTVAAAARAMIELLVGNAAEDGVG
ncbi:hypothetical protein C7E12_03485 [Stenotrophomonas maltophilia]|nr:hypothetical protein C7E12_03485 [Stenotrophomonas maltophilia]